MDRPIVQPGMLLPDTILLAGWKNALYGLGHLAQAALGTGTCVVGLVGAQSTVPDLHISIGAGAIYSSQPVDATAYGSLGTDANTIVKQGILAAPTTLTLTAPVTSGYSQVYLVEACYSDTDGGAITEPYYNSASPSSPLNGPANSGASQYTTRQGVCTITLKAGTAAPTGSQTTPSTDAGYVPLYTITMANGQTAITTAQIVTVAGAPFVPYNLNNLPTNFLPLAGGTMTGPLKAPAGFSTVVVGVGSALTFTAAQSGAFFEIGAAATFTVTLPSVQNGLRYTGFSSGVNGVTLAAPINMNINSAVGTSFFLPQASYFDIWCDGGTWTGFACGPNIYTPVTPLASRTFSTSSSTYGSLSNNTLSSYALATASANFGAQSGAAFTFTQAGVYSVTSQMSLTVNYTGTSNVSFVSAIEQNSAVIASNQVGNWGSSPESASIGASTTITVSIGDTIRLYGSVANSAFTSGGINSATLSIVKIV